jgi:hypothetical protein
VYPSDRITERYSLGEFAFGLSTPAEIDRLKKAIAAAIGTEPMSRAALFLRYEFVEGLPYSSRLYLDFMSQEGRPLPGGNTTIVGLAYDLIAFFRGKEARYDPRKPGGETDARQYKKGFEVFRTRAFGRKVLLVEAKWVKGK